MAATLPPASTVRELALLAAGVGILLAGLLARPRDPALVSTGVGLLVATPAAAKLAKDDDGD